MYEARQNKEKVSRTIQNFNNKKTQQTVKKQIKSTNKYIIQAFPSEYIDEISNKKSSKEKKNMFAKFIPYFLSIANESELFQDPFTKICIIGIQNRKDAYGWTELFVNIENKYVSEDEVQDNTHLDNNTNFELRIVLNMSKIPSEQALFTTFFHEWYAHANAGDYLQRINNVRKNGIFSKAADDIEKQEHTTYSLISDEVVKNMVRYIDPNQSSTFYEDIISDINSYK